jgi:hypothetical protein
LYSLKLAVTQRLKPQCKYNAYGTAEAVPFQSRFKLHHQPARDTISAVGDTTELGYTKNGVKP